MSAVKTPVVRKRKASAKKCCLCDKRFEEFGNNPWPLDTVDRQCCDKCNRAVLLARLSGVRDVVPRRTVPFWIAASLKKFGK